MHIVTTHPATLLLPHLQKNHIAVRQVCNHGRIASPQKSNIMYHTYCNGTASHMILANLNKTILGTDRQSVAVAAGAPVTSTIQSIDSAKARGTHHGSNKQPKI